MDKPKPPIFLYILLFFSVVETTLMKNNAVMVITYGLRAFVALLGYFLMLKEMKYNRRLTNASFFTIAVLYACFILISSFANKNLTAGIAYTLFCWIGLLLYVNSQRENISALINVFDKIFIMITFLTFLLSFFMPDLIFGVSYDNTVTISGLYGGKNALQFYVIPAAAINIINHKCYQKGSKLLFFIIQFLYCFQLFYSGSGTARIIVMTFYIIYLTGVYKHLNTFWITLINAVLFFSIIVYRLHEKLLYNLIVNRMNRDLSLTYRTDIWDIVLHYIKKKPILGYGSGTELVHNNLVLPSWYEGYINEAHNGFLEILLGVGAVGLIIFLIIVGMTLIKLDLNKKLYQAKVIKLFILVYSFIGLSESAYAISKSLFWIIVFLGYSIDSFGKSKDDQASELTEAQLVAKT